MNDDGIERGPFADEALMGNVVGIRSGGKPAVAPFGKRVLQLTERMRSMEKDGYNDFQSYAYLSEAAVKRRFNEALCACDLFISAIEIHVLPESTSHDVLCRVVLQIKDVHSEAFVIWSGIGGGVDKGDKAAMKANTAAWKYAVTNGAAVSTGDDPEADTSTDKSPPSLDDRIEAAKNAKQLEKLLSELTALRGTSDFERLKAGYNAKLMSFSKGGK